MALLVLASGLCACIPKAKPIPHAEEHPISSPGATNSSTPETSKTRPEVTIVGRRSSKEVTGIALLQGPSTHPVSTLIELEGRGEIVVYSRTKMTGGTPGGSCSISGRYLHLLGPVHKSRRHPGRIYEPQRFERFVAETWKCESVSPKCTPRWPRVPERPIRTLDDAEAQELVRARLGDEFQLRHPVFAGPLGPTDDGALLIVSPPSPGPHDVEGFVVPLDDSEHPPIPLPSLNPFEHHVDDIEMVALHDDDKDGRRDIVVVAAFISGMGPDGVVPYDVRNVIRWNGCAFEHLPTGDRHIDELRGVGDVEKK